MAILITRPEPQGKLLCDVLNKNGIAALHMPLFKIESGCELNQLPNSINQLNSGDYVVAVSKNAINYAAQSLYNAGFHWRNDLHYFCVGKGSAEFFSVQTEKNVQFPSFQQNSEGLLELDAMQKLQGKQILILRGNGGREFFSEKALLRGANIQFIECYNRVSIQYDGIEQTSMLKRSGVDSLVVTSHESLDLLLDAIPENEHSWLKNCRLIVVSQRLASIGKLYGWKQINISLGADNQSLLQIISSLVI